MLPARWYRWRIISSSKPKHYSHAPARQALTWSRSPLEATLLSGSQAVPIQRVLEILPAQGILQLNAEHSPDGIRLGLRINVGDRSLSFKKGDIQLVARNPMWLLAEQYLCELEGDFPDYLLMNLLETPEL